MSNNKYIDTYIDNYARAFRGFIKGRYIVNIGGLKDFVATDDHDVTSLINKLQSYGFEVTISAGQDTVDEIQVEYTCEENGERGNFEYRIENLISIIDLSSKTGISIVGILLMQIISKLICKTKVIYKAVILDLDDTVWKGTLAEDGIEAIKQNLRSSEALPFVAFMRFIQAMVKEIGLYIAVCSRNDTDKVQSAIDTLNEEEFPLKGHIDCIVANNNAKSENIKAIARQLSILPKACVFIDDNPLVRDEVRQNLPEVFVPDWENHDELLTLLIACCAFDRFELSLKSRNRKRLYKVLQQEREKSHLPLLFVKAIEDIGHKEAVRLYAKSNQFRFAEKKGSCEGRISLVFELYRDNGESLGMASAVTYTENEKEVHVLNWAISCRYFEIGLEEYILRHIVTLSGGRSITFTFNDTGLNARAVALMAKYKSGFVKTDEEGIFRFIPDRQLMDSILSDTNLKEYTDKKYIYTVGYTLFQQNETIDIGNLFDTLKKYGIDFLIDVRSVPSSRHYPQCNADNLKIAGKNSGVEYMSMLELGAKAGDQQDVFSMASDIFFEKEVFPIAKSYRPEKTELHGSDEIVDFRKFRHDDLFAGGLKRIEDAYGKGFTLCLMCSEKNPMDCHRYFLISKALEQRFGDWLEVRHIIGKTDGSMGYISNRELDKQVEEFVCEKRQVLRPMFKDDVLKNYFGTNEQEKINDFCDRYWNLLHGWKRFGDNNENHD